MTVTYDEVSAELNRDEPDYAHAATLGADALPHLQRMVDEGDPMLASKAAYLASLIPEEGSIGVLISAAHHEDVTVRVASAAGTANLAYPAVSEVVLVLLKDSDSGVRRLAAGAAGELMTPQLHEALGELAAGDPDPTVRHVVAEALEQEQS